MHELLNNNFALVVNGLLVLPVQTEPLLQKFRRPVSPLYSESTSDFILVHRATFAVWNSFRLCVYARTWG